MINLLPEQEKEMLFLKRIKNLVIVLAGIIIIFLICLVFVLLFIKFYVLAKVDEQKILVQETQKEYRSPGSENFKNTIQKYNKVLPEVLSFYQEKAYFSDILEIISGIEKPKGLYLTNISINGAPEKNNVKLNISGASNTRENLIAFQKNLGNQPDIKNISFSPESWISPTNVNFSIALEFDDD